MLWNSTKQTHLTALDNHTSVSGGDGRSRKDYVARIHFVRVHTFLLLRWIVIIGQMMGLLIVDGYFQIGLPFAACLVVIAVSISFNVYMTLSNTNAQMLDEKGGAISLVFDVTQFAVMLFLTGGLNNPFSVLLLGPVVISASILSRRMVLYLAVLSVMYILALTQFYIPVIFRDGSSLNLPGIFEDVVALAMILSVILLSGYSAKVANETQNMNDALIATNKTLEQEQRIAAIGGLAAAAAHELGTPLATIKLVSSELAKDLKSEASNDKPSYDPEIIEDINLIRKEADRCRAILQNMARLTHLDDPQMKYGPVSSVIEEAAKPHRDEGKRIIIRIEGASPDEIGPEQPEISRAPEVIHGLRNFIQNAVEFAASNVWIDVEENDGYLTIAVGDDGPGFSVDLIERMGRPYISERDQSKRKNKKHVDVANRVRRHYEGMGLGVFIANTLLAPSGAQVSFSNGSDKRVNRIDKTTDAPELENPTGAIVTMRWELERIKPQINK